MQSLRMTVLMAACVLIGLPVPAMAATLLPLDLVLPETLTHRYDSETGLTSIQDSGIATGPNITTDLGNFDTIAIQASLPDGQAYRVNPPAEFQPITVGFSAEWRRDSSTVPGSGAIYTVAASLLGGDGPSAPLTFQNAFVRDEGSQILIGFSFTLPDGIFEFSGLQASIDGPFSSNGATPLEARNLFLSFSSPDVLGSPADPGPFVTVVPEPTSLAVLGFGGLLVASRRRRV
ncbi:MAG: PEP-CTERM sorting domain-containing protein [Planctomycetota bacterium]